MYPWPSLGGFQFKRDETVIWGTDTGWVRTPAYSRQRPLGSANDVIVALAIGSAERNFEVYLSTERYAALELLVNSIVVFTDWLRPIPDSRQVVVASIEPGEEVVGVAVTGLKHRKVRTRINLITA